MDSDDVSGVSSDSKCDGEDHSKLQANRNQIMLAPKRTMTQRLLQYTANTNPLKTPKFRKIKHLYFIRTNHHPVQFL